MRVAPAALFLVLAATAGYAQSPSPSPSIVPSPAASSTASADCSIVASDEIAQVLGFAVTPPDDSSRSGGICFFASRSISDNGSASYALVDMDRLQQRRAYYAVLARRCAGVQQGAPHELSCKTFAALSQVKDIDGYFASRTNFPNAEVVKGLGDAAVAAGEALYVKRGDVVFEVTVRRGETLDLDRATALAKLLLARTPVPPTPEPTASPRRPKGS
ncbi:MAG: hypothetical protein IAI49_08885 [Candidatus Eremiobacteraeota bacterium]|nr:hypothetical protein [Candidatus Eremiobacteraeota bacterium]